MHRLFFVAVFGILIASCSSGGGSSESIQDRIKNSSYVDFHNQVCDEDISISNNKFSLSNVDMNGKQISVFGNSVYLFNVKNATVYIAESVQYVQINDSNLFSIYCRGSSVDLSIISSSVNSITMAKDESNLVMDGTSCESLLLMGNAISVEASPNSTSVYENQIESLKIFSGADFVFLSNINVKKIEYADEISKNLSIILRNTICVEEIDSGNANFSYHSVYSSVYGNAQDVIYANPLSISSAELKNVTLTTDDVFYGMRKTRDVFYFYSKVINSQFDTIFNGMYAIIRFSNGTSQKIDCTRTYFPENGISATPEGQVFVNLHLNWNGLSYTFGETVEFTIKSSISTAIPATIIGEKDEIPLFLDYSEAWYEDEVDFEKEDDGSLKITHKGEYTEAEWNFYLMAEEDKNFEANQNYMFSVDIRTDNSDDLLFCMEAQKAQSYFTLSKKGDGWTTVSVLSGSYAQAREKLWMCFALGRLQKSKSVYLNNLVVEAVDDNTYPLRAWSAYKEIFVKNGKLDSGEYYAKFDVKNGFSRTDNGTWYADTKIIMTDKPLYGYLSAIKFTAKLKAEKSGSFMQGWAKSYEEQNRYSNTWMWTDVCEVGTEWQEITWYYLNTSDDGNYHEYPTYPTVCMALSAQDGTSPVSNTFYMKDLQIEDITASVKDELSFYAVGSITNNEFVDITDSPLEFELETPYKKSTHSYTDPETGEITTYETYDFDEDKNYSGTLDILFIPKGNEPDYFLPDLKPVLRNNVYDYYYGYGPIKNEEYDNYIFSNTSYKDIKYSVKITEGLYARAEYSEID